MVNFKSIFNTIVLVAFSNALLVAAVPNPQSGETDLNCTFYVSLLLSTLSVEQVV